MLISSDFRLDSSMPKFTPLQVAVIQQAVLTALADHAPYQAVITTLRTQLSPAGRAAARSAAETLVATCIDTLQRSVVMATLQAIDPTLAIAANPATPAAEPAEVMTPDEPGDVFQDWLEQLAPIAPPLDTAAMGAKTMDLVDSSDDVAQAESEAQPRPSVRQLVTQSWWPRSPSPTDLATQRQADWIAKVQQIMAHLRQTREQRGMSLQELHQRTHITLHQLQVLESGQVEDFPEEIYLRGFIRRMAQALGLNGLELAQSLPHLGGDTTSKARSAVYATHPVPSNGRGLLPTPSVQPLHLYLAYGALISGAATGLNGVMRHQSTAAVLPPLEPTIATPSDRDADLTELGQLDGRGLASFQEIAPPDVIPEFHR